MNIFSGSNLSQSVGWSLVHFVWQGAAIALVAWLLFAICPKRRPDLRYLIGCAAMLAMLLSPVVTTLWLASGAESTVSAPPVVLQGETVSREAGSNGVEKTIAPVFIDPERRYSGAEFVTGPGESRPARVNGPAAPQFVGFLRSVAQVVTRAMPVLTLIWSAGVCLLSLKLVFGWLLVKRIQRSGSVVQDRAIVEMFGKLKSRLQVDFAVSLRESIAVHSPTVIGWLRPVILLPLASMSGLNQQQLAAILAHELAHIRRADYLVNLIQAVIETLLFYHPAVWWLSRRIREERENCCDDLAVAVCGDKRTYVEALLKLEQSRPPTGSLAMASSGGDLVNRVARILGQDPCQSNRTGFATRPNWIAAAMAVAIVGTLFATSFADQHAFGNPVVQEPDKAEQKPQEKEDRKIRIYVVAPDNSPIGNSSLHLNIAGRDPVSNQVYVTNQDKKTDKDGIADFKLPDGMEDVRLWASAEGYTRLFTSWENEGISQGELPVKEFTFQMIAAIEIGGIFVDENDQPIEGVSVEVRGSSEIQIPNKKVRLPGTLAYGDTALVSGADGKWSLANVPPGDDVSISLRITHPDYISDEQYGGIQKSQSIGFREMRDKSAKIALRKGIRVRGKVTNEAGEPISDALIIWGNHPYGQEGSQEIPVNADGSYQTPSQKPGQLRLTVVAPGFAPEMTMVDVAQDMPPTDFVLAPGKRLEIRFVDEQGQPVPRVYVGIDRWRKAESLYNNRHPNVRNTRIPVRSDDNGVYIWDWAPEDAVEYTFSSEGFHIQRNVSLTADDDPINIVIKRVREITGTVTDTDGNPVESFSVIPRMHVNERIPSERRERMARGKDGKFLHKIDLQDGIYSLKIEADGYEPAITDPFERDAETKPFDIKLTPLLAAKRLVVNEDGQPVPGATVVVAPQDQVLSLDSYFNAADLNRSQNTKTGEDGSFTLPESSVPRTLMAVSPDGYGEVTDYSDKPSKQIVVKKWGKLNCFITKNGKPLDTRYMIHPVRYLSATNNHIQMLPGGTSVGKGEYRVGKLAPIPTSISLVSNDGRDRLRIQLAFDPMPGEETILDFANCTRVNANIKLAGSNADKADLAESTFSFMRLEPSARIPDELKAEIHDAGLEKSGVIEMLRQFEEEGKYMAIHCIGNCLDSYHGQPGNEGEFSVDILRPGKYQLRVDVKAKSINKAKGVVPLGEYCQIVEIESQPTDLGNIEIRLLDDPEPGSPIDDFEFDILTNQSRSSLRDYRGKYLLLDFWSPFCESCQEDTPKVQRLAGMLAAKGLTTIVSIRSGTGGQLTRVSASVPGGVVWLDGQISYNEEWPIQKKLGVWNTQHLVLIDPEGNYVVGGSLAAVVGKMEELGLK